MQRSIQYAVAAFVLSITIACRHQPLTSSVPPPPPGKAEAIVMQPDQVNIEGWDKAWTNLLNDSRQSFIPALPKLLGVEVELIVGNPGNPEDELILTILDSRDQALARVTQLVKVDDSSRVLFMLPNGGIELSPGQVYSLQLTGGPTFGWKYVVGGYDRGEATFAGKPLLQDARSTFLFRTFGSK